MNKIIRLPHPTRRTTINSGQPGDGGVRTDGVYVVFTASTATLAAARAAHDLAAAMKARMTVLHFRPVPDALPLNERTRAPNAETEALASRLRAEGIPADVCVYLCRSERDAALMTLKPHSIVVVGGRHAWWPTTRAARWRRALEASGHLVVAVDARQFQQEARGASTTEPAMRIEQPVAGVAAFARGLPGHSTKERARV